MDDQKGQSYNAIEAFTLKTNKRKLISSEIYKRQL